MAGILVPGAYRGEAVPLAWRIKKGLYFIEGRDGDVPGSQNACAAPDSGRHRDDRSYFPRASTMETLDSWPPGGALITTDCRSPCRASDRFAEKDGEVTIA